jgi:hypothetical protein
MRVPVFEPGELLLEQAPLVPEIVADAPHLRELADMVGAVHRCFAG